MTTETFNTFRQRGYRVVNLRRCTPPRPLSNRPIQVLARITPNRRSVEPTWSEVRLGEPYAAVEVVNLKEEPLGQAEVEDGRVRLSLKPNEIITLRFRTSR